MFAKVLVANRGEIAGRIIATLRRMGVGSVAVYSDADRFTRPVREADEAMRIGPASAAESYLDAAAIIEACRQTGAEAVHPGYGFLSEKPEFAEALAAAGIRFIGPDPAHMRAFGLKHSARALAEAEGVPLLPGSGLLADAGEAAAEAARIGYPVMLKSTAGGGGIGMQICRDARDLAEKWAGVQRLSGANFGDARVYLERYIARARHVEVQIFGDGEGGIVTLGERDCSLQRRHQKVIEETPAPGLSATTRDALSVAARALGQSVGYRSAGTVEFVLDAESGAFYFLEVNTRLQVEHCVTEAVFGVDLVEWMVAQAAGEFVLPPQSALVPQGAAVEARIYAENPARGFRPSSGLLTEVRFADGVRVDGWIETGAEVTPHYDPLLAKMIAHGADRAEAVARLAAAIGDSAIWGIESNLAYLGAVLAAPVFGEAQMTTATLDAFEFAPRTIEVLAPGTQTSLQDWPGRIGYWDVGVPPSGPMDDRSCRLANRILGNPEGAAALEITLAGPTLRFEHAAVIALAGARMPATLDGAPVPWFEPVAVGRGQVLAIGRVAGAGSRAYLAVEGGFDAPLYLGARATFALGGFGGHATGCLRIGDTLRIGAAPVGPRVAVTPPVLTHDWEIGVLYGPHGAPDFFQDADIADLFRETYEVHYNSARTGVRLIGPRPRWARADGGEAGLHPSNIHDNAYAVGAIDFTGDMPIILGPDGPSLGGFVCPAVVVRDELWKLGQLRPGDRVRFRVLSLRDARVAFGGAEGPVLRRVGEGDAALCYRIAGDSYLLVEFGPPVLDIALRLRAQLMMERLRSRGLDGIIDLVPGIRSLQVHYDPDVLTLGALMAALETIEPALADIADARVPSRVVHLPLSWDDEQARLAMTRYQELVRPDAPWCPSNIEFIRRINGLDDIEAVKRIIFAASYLVLGLGDVYLGAPVATPLDPRHRLVTTKYNPARTWTPENAVGIGGAYLCVYGMEGPGGYQLFGRTIQMWNAWMETEVFPRGTPWLLRFFDQIRFYPVSADELLDARARFPRGQYPIVIEETEFDLGVYRANLAEQAPAIAAFRVVQRAAFAAERERWRASGLDRADAEPAPEALPDDALAEGLAAVEASLPGNVWKVLVQPGDAVAAGDAVVIVESMKMEMRILSAVTGVVAEVLCTPGREVKAGQRLLVVKTLR
ncbi:MAG: 5-oxoprolinase/urea amidolyase family protein [Proteobacteria bacterium]|nr:5-oxoprolinase/urea amidolyase family protein [Pseudomonadota bacterium]